MKRVIPIFVILILVCFFQIKIIPIPYQHYAYGYRFLFLIFFMLFALTKNVNVFRECKIRRGLLLYITLIMLNCYTCLLYRQQPIYVSLLAWSPFFLLLFYPTFKSWNLSIKTWEFVLETLFIILLIGYILQNVFMSVQLFNIEQDFEKLEIESRIRIFSDGILSLGALYCYNKYLIHKKLRLLILFVLASLMLFLQGFRMILFAYVLICAILTIRILGNVLKTVVVSAVALVVLSMASQLSFVKDKIGEISERNEVANFDQKDYVRVVELNFFYNSYFKDNLELFLGAGQPIFDYNNPKATNYSRYSTYRSDLANTYHFYPVDLGLIGLSLEAGIPFTCFFVFIMLFFAFKKVDKPYYYLGMWELMLVMIGVTHPLCYYHNNLIYSAMVFTMIDIVNTNKKHLKVINYTKDENRHSNILG